MGAHKRKAIRVISFYLDLFLYGVVHSKTGPLLNVHYQKELIIEQVEITLI